MATCRCVSKNHGHKVPCTSPEVNSSDHLCKLCGEMAAREAAQANEQHETQETPPHQPPPNPDLFKS